MGVSKKRIETVENYLSLENLTKYYPIYSANYIAKKLFYPDFTTNASTVIKYLKKYGISPRSISESTKLDSSIKLKKDTIYSIYGVDNVSKSEDIKRKKEEKSIQKYGTRNVFQAEEIKAKLAETCIKKYGTPKIGRLQLKSSGKRSKFHQKIEDILIRNNIHFESEVPNLCCGFNTFYNRDYSPIVDIFISPSIIIECYGNFWHANPKKYIGSDIFNTWEGKKTAQQIWDKDNNREEHIKSFGFDLIIVWEYMFTSNRQKCEEFILNEIKNIENRRTK